MATLVFLKRTQKEIEIFGGDVYFDIDGKNAGKLTLSNQIVNVEPGEHTIKMYKSHTFDTFIGFAESVITVGADEKLMIKYSAPMMVNQPGNMVISEYSLASEESALKERERTISRDYIAEENRKKEANEKYKSGVIIVFVVAIVFAIIYGIYINSLWW